MSKDVASFLIENIDEFPMAIMFENKGNRLVRSTEVIVVQNQEHYRAAHYRSQCFALDKKKIEFHLLVLKNPQYVEHV